jgi:signal transduction histidine kinase
MALAERPKASPDQLEAIFRALPDLLFELAPDGTILGYRAGRVEDLYTTPVDFLGKRMSDVLPPETGQLLQTAIDRVVAGDALVTVEYSLTVSGSAKYFEARLVPFGGNVIVVARDVTQQRRAIEERRELDRKVLEAQRLESLGVLAGGLAHDYNNLLAAILASADLVARHVPEGSPMSAPLEIVRQSAWRASELSRQLLAYAGKGRIEAQTFDVRALVLDTAQLLGAAKTAGARLELDLPVGLPAVHGDVAQLRQVVMNLITNASDAVSEHDGRVRLAARVVERDEMRWVEIVVEDDGVGMDEATRGRMFDPFFSTKGAGRGLGLAAVLGIVRSHGGHIDVESAPGAGTRILVRLPASDRPPEPLGSTPAAVRRHRMRGTVLVVDDEGAVRDATAAILADAGLVVHTAEDGRQALDIVGRGRRFDAIVLDVTMPRMGGLEALAAIRAIDPHVPVLLISGYSDTDQLRAAAAHAFLQKPFPAEALLTAITTALESRPAV